VRTSRLLGLAIVATLVPAAFLADRAHVRARSVVEADAERSARERAVQAANALRAEMASIERDAAARAQHRGAQTERFAAPLSARLAARSAGLHGMSRADLIVATVSHDVTPSGLPVAVIAALELGESDAERSVVDRLLSGRLPVMPDDLPRLAERLGAGGDPRVASLLARLRAVPPRASLPNVPDFARAAAGDEAEGWALDGEDVIHWRIPSIQALVGDAARVADIGILVDGISGLRLVVPPDRAPLVRLGRQRALTIAAFVALGLLGLWACAMLAREERSVARERAFIASITHELRTPVTAVRLLGETLAEGRGDARAYGELVASEAARLEALVERSLLAARTDARLAFADADVGAILERAVRLAAPLAERRGKRVELLAASLPKARWDAEAVRQAVSNLVDNALRHGGSHVRIGASLREGSVRVDVVDDGPGIARRDRRRVFGRFERASSATGGTGLGLWLVERVARAHGGRVELRTGDGEGCAFTLVLPLEAAP
jgi:signal transduction histidine kinase